jgi:hypothetical protein
MLRIKSGKENGCAVYWWEPKAAAAPHIYSQVEVTQVINRRCFKCSKDAVTFLDYKPVCLEHSKQKVEAPSLF